MRTKGRAYLVGGSIGSLACDISQFESLDVISQFATSCSESTARSHR